VGDQFKITVNNVKDLSEKVIHPEYNFATGFVRGCSFPLNLGKWSGTTNQDKPVAFTISDDGLSLLNFTITMKLGGECTSSCDIFGGCSTTCRVNVTPTLTIPTRIDVIRINGVNCSFQCTYEELVKPGTDFKMKVTISGVFTSESKVEGKWEGEYPGDIEVLPGGLKATIATGSGTWSASYGYSELVYSDHDIDGTTDGDKRAEPAERVKFSVKLVNNGTGVALGPKAYVTYSLPIEWVGLLRLCYVSRLVTGTRSVA
jgi:hypothetical protein